MIFIKNQPVAEYKSLNLYHFEKILEKYGYFCKLTLILSELWLWPARVPTCKNHSLMFYSFFFQTA